MPLYEYLCGSCGHRFERIQKFSDPPVRECPSCAGRVEKQISSPAIQFKGSGFYITDYAKSGQSESKTDSASSTSKASQTSSSGEASSSSEAKSASTESTAKPATPAATDKK